MQLKQYQQRALDILEQYLSKRQTQNPRVAFLSVVSERQATVTYHQSFAAPNVCIKIPTGGGKTLVASHSIGLLYRTLLQHKLDRGIVLWLVPSEAIKSQTIKKLSDRRDPHRQILDSTFENRVRIFSNEEALSIKPGDIVDNVCIIVATLDAFRREKQTRGKYRVYKENGALLGHFDDAADRGALERDDQGTIVTSLANVVRLNNPLIVIDEGHRANTGLSIEFIDDLNPAFIIEYTATPRPRSNVLVDIHATELKAEEMVKIPIVLESASHWEQTIDRGIDKRNELEMTTKKLKGEYIRPIALLQAQPDSKAQSNVTVEKVRQFLLGRNIPPEQIAIKISGQNDLEGINLFSQSCKIRYIITVNALAEGWDCAYAYVLISVANIGAPIAVEQIIGRIIRMPSAACKKDEELNRCYVFASARNFAEAADKIVKGLKDNGYSSADIVRADKKDVELMYEAHKQVKETLTVPQMALNGEGMSFEDLLGADFRLDKQDHSLDLQIHEDNDGQAIIDIREDDQWVRGVQLTLKLRYRDRNFTEADLVQWIDKKLNFPMLNQEDRTAFISKVVLHQIKSNQHTLADLSVNRYALLGRMQQAIQDILDHHCERRFRDYLKKGKLSTEGFTAFPDTITLRSEIPQGFNKSYYSKVDGLNREELRFIERLDSDTLPNIKYWVRNREKTDPFYIQGWKRGKFYPDFVAVTKQGNIIALEWKGEDRVSNEDTDYKEEIGKTWEQLGKGKLHFFLVHNGNIEEVLTKIKAL
jgi:superfamily II DNA or RNA helicase